jgi:biotin carboxylase
VEGNALSGSMSVDDMLTPAACADVSKPKKSSKPIRRVVVFCHLGRAGYNMQRALRAIGVRTYLVYDHGAASVRWSRGCKPIFKADDLRTADIDRIAAKINELHRKVEISSVISTDLQSSILLTRIQDVLIPPVFPIPKLDTLLRLDNKWSFSQLCRACNVSIPKTLYFETNRALDLHRIADELGYPVIVKPVVGYGQRNIVVLRNAGEAALFQSAASHQSGLVVQEYVTGRDWSLSVLARDGIVTHWTAWECPAQLRKAYGVARFMTTSFRRHDALIDAGKKIVAATGFSGVANFDARVDQNGRMVVFECNPRFFNRMLAARMCGLNFVAAGLPEFALKQRCSLTDGDYYPWQELFTLRGLNLLLTGKWKINHLLRDVGEMLRDPLPPLLRKLTREDEMDYS